TSKPPRHWRQVLSSLRRWIETRKPDRATEVGWGGFSERPSPPTNLEGRMTMKPLIVPATAGFEMLEIHGDEVFRAAVLALGYDADRGVVPLGAGDRIDSTDRTAVALVLSDGRVEM